MSILTKLSDGFQYLANRIKRLESRPISSSNGSGGGINYELDKEIQTNDIWINGKSIFIYGTYFTPTTTGVTGKTIPYLSCVDECIDCFGYHYATTYQTFSSLTKAWPNYLTTGDFLKIGKTLDGIVGPAIRIYFQSSGSVGNGSYTYMFIKYTKQ